MGIIDTLSAGFDLVRRKLWLILLPVLLDIGIWIAPKLSIATLVDKWMNAMLAQMAELPVAMNGMPEAVQMLVDAAETINLSSLLSATYLNMPSLPIPLTTSLFGLTRQVVEVSGLPGLMALAFGLLLAGFFLGMMYLAPIAENVRSGYVEWGSLLRRLPGDLLRLAGGLLLTLIVLTLISWPLSLAMGVFGLFSQGIASLTLGFTFAAMLWVLLYLAFVPEAILLGRDGVLQAVAHSITIVRVNFWPTVGLMILVNIISGGLMLVFERLTGSTVGALVAIVANAFVGTGLTAAVFIYYRERLQAWKETVEQLRGQV